jgi:hypothetical protein
VNLSDEGIIDNLRFCPGDCDDSNVCTTDRCDPDDTTADADGCIHVANDDTCDDGIYCNGTDGCRDGACVVHGGDPCLGGPECAATCNELSRNCFARAGTPCTDDGNVCTDDRCNAAGACTHAAGADSATIGFTAAPARGEGEECDEDADACTADVCRSGECAHERLVEPSVCTLLQDPLRQTLSLGVQVDGLIALVGPDGPEGLLTTLARIHEDLAGAARALGGKTDGAIAMTDSPFRHRVRLALAAVKPTRRRIAAFLDDLARPGVRARLGSEVADEVERRGRLLGQAVRALKSVLRPLRRVLATFVHARPRP